MYKLFKISHSETDLTQESQNVKIYFHLTGAFFETGSYAKVKNKPKLSSWYTISFTEFHYNIHNILEVMTCLINSSTSLGMYVRLHHIYKWSKQLKKMMMIMSQFKSSKAYNEKLTLFRHTVDTKICPIIKFSLVKDLPTKGIFLRLKLLFYNNTNILTSSIYIFGDMISF